MRRKKHHTVCSQVLLCVHNSNSSLYPTVATILRTSIQRHTDRHRHTHRQIRTRTHTHSHTHTDTHTRTLACMHARTHAHACLFNSNLYYGLTCSDHYTISPEDCSALSSLTGLQCLSIRSWLPRPFSTDLKVLGRPVLLATSTRP